MRLVSFIVVQMHCLYSELPLYCFLIEKRKNNSDKFCFVIGRVFLSLLLIVYTSSCLSPLSFHYKILRKFLIKHSVSIYWFLLFDRSMFLKLIYYINAYKGIFDFQYLKNTAYVINILFSMRVCSLKFKIFE